ncbi:Short stature homeobox protein 2 [Basidiobolus ranarum]|uniref:Short stature homeobox protein 2 n=1 Tax=Basidiobolus ranarum TaxID=34480 RepID=A0ABR2WE18_9FUNG
MSTRSLDDISCASSEPSPVADSYEIDRLLREFNPEATVSVHNGGRAVKAKRKRANPHQIKMLNQILSRNNFPSKELREKIAQKVGMHPRSVQIWFQNKRQEMKKKPQSNDELSPDAHNSPESTTFSMSEPSHQPIESLGNIKLPSISNLLVSSDKYVQSNIRSGSSTRLHILPYPHPMHRHTIPKLKLPVRSVANLFPYQAKLRQDLLELKAPLEFRL